jgi:hypothetical protein
MSNRTAEKSEHQVGLSLSVPDFLFEDLKKVASFSGMSIEELAYSYIVEGIAGDSRTVKRVEFEQQASENFQKSDFHTKPARDIVNDFNLVY